MSIITKNVDPSTVPTPSSGKTAFGTNTSSEVFIKDDAGNVTIITSGGTVTSVAASGSQGVTISGSPITTSGTITVGLGAITPTSVAATGTVTGSNLSGTNTGDQTITLTGDVTGSGTGTFTTTIANAAVSNSKLADVSTGTIKGRVLTGTGEPQDLTGTEATTLLDVFTPSLKGLAPASGGGSTNFLRADGTWASPPGDGPGGSDTQIQYNDSGSFAASSSFTWNDSTKTLTLTPSSGTGVMTLTANGSGTGGTVFTGIAPDGVNATTPILFRQANNTTVSAAPYLGLQRSRGTAASPAAVQSGDGLGGISFQGHDGTNFGGSVNLLAEAAQTFSGSTRAGRLVISVRPQNSLIATTVLRLQHNGTQAEVAYPAGNGTTLLLSGTHSFKSSTGSTTYATINLATSAAASTDLVRKSDLDAKKPAYELQVAIANQTVFDTTVNTVANDSGLASLQVFINGVKQIEGASYGYTVTGANQITLNSGTNLNDVVEFYVFGA
jgi:hypothetical protein